MKRNETRQAMKTVLAQMFIVSATLALTGTAKSQTGSNRPQATLPSGPIWLAFRGRVGDYTTYQVKSAGHQTQKIVTQGQMKLDSDSSDEQAGTITLKVLSVSRQGGVTLERRDLYGRKTGTRNGKKEVEPGRAQNLIETYTPTWKRLAYRPLVADKNGKTGRAADIDDGGLGSPMLLPNKAVRVGDTWPITRRIRVGPVEKSDSYRVRLAAVELFRGVPCARLESRVTNDLSKLGDGMQALNAGEKVTSDGRSEGKITAYYSLDRGMPLSFRLEINTV